MNKRSIFFDNYGIRMGWVIAIGTFVFASFIGLLIPIITHFQIVNDRNSCHTYGAAANREVKFVRLTFGTDVCLTKNDEGQWIDIKSIRSITTGGN